MKKKLIAASMAAAMTLSLAACGGSGASSTASAGDTASTAASTEAASGDEQINLRMAWWGSQDRHDKTIAAIELYESLNPNVKIEYEYYSFDDYFTKLKTLVASDQVWDVFQMGGNFPMYIDKICPLDDYIASGVVDTSGITGAVHHQLVRRPEACALPADSDECLAVRLLDDHLCRRLKGDPHHLL